MDTNKINLSPKPNQNQEQVFQLLEPESQNQFQNTQNFPPNSTTLSIKLHDCYVVIHQGQATAEYESQQEWDQLINKSYKQRIMSMDVVTLNSIIGLVDMQQREKIWGKVISQMGIQGEENEQISEVEPKIVKQIQYNVEKLSKKQLFQFYGQNGKTEEIKVLLKKLIIMYEGRQPNLGTLKGLQYIICGILLACPYNNFQNIKNSFLYFMEKLEIRQIYYHGSPMFYAEVGQICSQLKNESADLYEYLQKNQVDWAKIFIAYYKTLLLNKIKNKYLISKLFDLVLIYGISIIRMMLVRIINELQSQLLKINDPNQLMKIMGTNLISMYFQPSASKITGTNHPTQEKKKLQQDKQFNIEIDQNKKTIKLVRKLIIGV